MFRRAEGGRGYEGIEIVRRSEAILTEVYAMGFAFVYGLEG